MGDSAQSTFMCWTLSKGDMISDLRELTFFHLLLDFAEIVSQTVEYLFDKENCVH